MKSSIYFLFLSILAFAGCGGTENETVKDVANKKVKSSSTQNSCLESYAMDPCKLISLADVAELSDVEVSSIEKKPPLDMFKNPMMRTCIFRWPSDRTMTVEVLSQSRTVPVENEVFVGSFQILDDPDSRIKPPYTEWFDRAYRQMTEEEQEKYQKMIDDEVDKQTNDDKQSSQAKSMAKSFMKMAGTDQYIKVDEVGDKATAVITKKSPQVSLNILHGNVKFNVNVNVSDDSEENLKLSKVIAQKILSRCD